MSGKPGADGEPAWSAEELAAMHGFMTKWIQDMIDSGEFVDARGLTAPVHARRIHVQNGVPVVTDGPYPETQEVLAGYNIVECASFDRATEIAALVANSPHPAGLDGRDLYVDVRPVDEGPGAMES
jgi:hypothetical protein